MCGGVEDPKSVNEESVVVWRRESRSVSFGSWLPLLLSQQTQAFAPGTLLTLNNPRGAQELAASVFSVAIALTHAHGLRRLRARCKTLAVGGAPPYPYLSLLTTHALLNLNGWVWSTVFHARCVNQSSPLGTPGTVRV